MKYTCDNETQLVIRAVHIQDTVQWFACWHLQRTTYNHSPQDPTPTGHTPELLMCWPWVTESVCSYSGEVGLVQWTQLSTNMSILASICVCPHSTVCTNTKWKYFTFTQHNLPLVAHFLVHSSHCSAPLYPFDVENAQVIPLHYVRTYVRMCTWRVCNLHRIQPAHTPNVSRHKMIYVACPSSCSTPALTPSPHPFPSLTLHPNYSQPYIWRHEPSLAHYAEHKPSTLMTSSESHIASNVTAHLPPVPDNGISHHQYKQDEKESYCGTSQCSHNPPDVLFKWGRASGARKCGVGVIKRCKECRQQGAIYSSCIA